VHDALVVGGGPAGLSAAMWLARYRRKVLLIDSGEYRNESVELVHGYLGCDPALPVEFRERARKELADYDTFALAEARAQSIEQVAEGFVLRTDDEVYEASRLVLATGVVDQFPAVENFFEHYGASVFHCPSCDGYEARGRSVAVFGWSEQVVGFALGLLDWAASVTVVTDGHPFEGDDRHRAALARAGVTLVEDEAVALAGKRGDLRRVTLRHGPPVECQLAFFSIAHQPVTELAAQLHCGRTADGYLEVNSENRTTTIGVYAAGDVTPGCQIVQVAAAKGAVAGTMCALSMHGDVGAPDSPRPAPAPRELGLADH
jgi:thioredoxin reductase